MLSLIPSARAMRFSVDLSVENFRFGDHWCARLYRACNHEDAGYGVSRRDHRCYQCYTVFRPIYRRGAVLYHYRASESDTGIIFPDLYRCVTADRRKYHWTEDPWKFYRIIGILGCICNSGIWRIMGIPGNAARCAVNGSDILCCTETVSYFLKKRGLTTDTLAYVYLTKVDKESNQPVYDKNPSKKS